MYLDKAQIDGKIYKTGDKLRYIRKPGSYDQFNGLMGLPINTDVEIVLIKSEERRRRQGVNLKTLFGVKTISGVRLEGWHDLEGNLARSNGYFIDKYIVRTCFAPITAVGNMIVAEKFEFRRRDLKDMKCRVVSPMPGNNESLVEFNKDIGGCGADGLGKSGHCLVVPNKILVPEEKANKTKQKKKPKTKVKSKKKGA
jgi:hypothetical protein